MPLYLYDPYHHILTKPTPLRARREQWMKREGSEYIGLLASALTELNIVSLKSAHHGPSEQEEDLFCVTLFGGAILAEAENQLDVSTPVAKSPLLIVQPNYDVLLMEFVPRLVYQLLSFAQLQRIGAVSEFRLTQKCLLCGMASGITSKQVETFLIEHIGQKDLPQNIVYTLQDWVKGYKEARLEEVILVELLPEQTQDTLYRALLDLPIEPRKLAPGLFAVASGKTSFLDLRRRLEKEGIVVRGEPAASSNHW